MISKAAGGRQMVRIDFFVFGGGVLPGLVNSARLGVDINVGRGECGGFIHVAGDIRAVAREGGRLHTGQVADVGVQPLGDRGDVVADLVELDAQCLIEAVVPQQCLETLCGGEVFET
jgi:hypothetical protein